MTSRWLPGRWRRLRSTSPSGAPRRCGRRRRTGTQTGQGRRGPQRGAGDPRAGRDGQCDRSGRGPGVVRSGPVDPRKHGSHRAAAFPGRHPAAEQHRQSRPGEPVGAPGGTVGARPRKVRAVEIPDGSTVAVPLSGPSDTYSAIVTRLSGPGQVHVGHVQLADGRSLTGTRCIPAGVDPGRSGATGVRQLSQCAGCRPARYLRLVVWLDVAASRRAPVRRWRP